MINGLSEAVSSKLCRVAGRQLLRRPYAHGRSLAPLWLEPPRQQAYALGLLAIAMHPTVRKKRTPRLFQTTNRELPFYGASRQCYRRCCDRGRRPKRFASPRSVVGHDDRRRNICDGTTSRFSSMVLCASWPGAPFNHRARRLKSNRGRPFPALRPSLAPPPLRTTIAIARR